MPALVRSRRYDEKFWVDIKYSKASGFDRKKSINTLCQDYRASTKKREKQSENPGECR